MHDIVEGPGRLRDYSSNDETTMSVSPPFFLVLDLKIRGSSCSTSNFTCRGRKDGAKTHMQGSDHGAYADGRKPTRFQARSLHRDPDSTDFAIQGINKQQLIRGIITWHFDL